jgi:hypothetical protein
MYMLRLIQLTRHRVIQIFSPVIRIMKRRNTIAVPAQRNSLGRVLFYDMVEILAAENFSFRTDDD